MPSSFRHLPRPAGLLCAAALALALPAVAPVTAGASAQSHALKQARHAQRKAAHLQQREERRAAHQQRKADRQAKQATRHEEREERRTTRAKEREERVGARSETATGPTTGSPTVPTGTQEGTATSPEAPAAARHDCSITATASAPEVKSGETVTVSGKLSCPGDEEGEAGEREVTIYQREARSGSSDPAVAGTVKTAPDGTYEFQSAALSGRSTFLVRYAGARHQARVVVQVSAGVSLQGPQPAGAALAMGANAAAGGAAKATFSGAIEPAEAGRQVALRVSYEGGEWRTVAFTRTGPEGQFSFTHKFRFAGAVEIVAVAHARGTERTQSQMLAYSIV
ncbi:MAG TPA: hypothetical protein VGI52_00005, partial [Solirubrobacteraceae bacterium]